MAIWTLNLHVVSSNTTTSSRLSASSSSPRGASPAACMHAICTAWVIPSREKGKLLQTLAAPEPRQPVADLDLDLDLDPTTRPSRATVPLPLFSDHPGRHHLFSIQIRPTLASSSLPLAAAAAAATAAIAAPSKSSHPRPIQPSPAVPNANTNSRSIPAAHALLHQLTAPSPTLTSTSSVAIHLIPNQNPSGRNPGRLGSIQVPCRIAPRLLDLPDYRVCLNCPPDDNTYIAASTARTNYSSIASSLLSRSLKKALRVLSPRLRSSHTT
ncbi:hypothetical protein CFRS1_v012136 [Colletotrichum fructicola]|nr:hypothetical protein CFRS1_v012136 [Colletotrichum fructicola]